MSDMNEKTPILLPGADNATDKPAAQWKIKRRAPTPDNLPTGAPSHESFFQKWGSLIMLSLALALIVIDIIILNASFASILKDLNLLVVVLLFCGSYLFKIKSVRIRIKEKQAKATQLDEVGILLALVGLLSIVFAIIESFTYGWWKAKETFTIGQYSLLLEGNISIVIPALIYGIIVLIIFFWWEGFTERMGNTPLVSLSIFCRLKI